jgi:phage gp36-like protein
MPYIVQADLETRFGSTELAQLTDHENGSVIDAGVVGLAISDAESEIDGYLAARYQLPLASVPPVLARIAADIARYRLWADQASEAVRKRYEDSVRDLKAISSGSIVIDGASPLAPSTTAQAVKVSAPNRVFNADLLARY